jgi:hypothetical protein
MPKSPADMWTAIIRNLPEKTGKTLEEWIPVLDACPYAQRKQRIAWLQEGYGLGHGQAAVIGLTLASVDEVDDDLREWLRRAYETIISAG